jgi:arsenate reductase
MRDTFTGIRPADVPGFVLAQLVGAAAGAAVWRWLAPTEGAEGAGVAAGEPGRARPAIRRGVGMKTVMFACTHNAGRSQMAAAFFNALADPARARAISAGTEPAERVHPEVVAAMQEVGLSLDGARPRRLTPELAEGVAWLVTMGCGEACPVVPGARREDWPVEDPKGRPLGEVRAIRDEVRRRVEKLIAAERWTATRGG